MTARKIVIAMSILMLASVCWGQGFITTYGTSGSPTTVSNVSTITNPAYNAWNNQNVALVNVSAAYNGDVSGLDASHCMWDRPADYPHHTAWVKDLTTPCLAVQVAILDGAHKYGLGTNQAATGCTGNYYPWMWWNSGNHLWALWGASQNACLLKGSLTVSVDGMICGIAPTGYPVCQNVLYGAGNSFQPISGVPAWVSGPWNSIAVVNAAKLYLSSPGLQGTCTLSGYVGALVCTWLPDAPVFLGGITQLAADSDGYEYALGYTVSGANVYRRKDDRTAWAEVYGTIANSLSIAGPQHVFVTKAAGGTYRIAENTRQTTITLTGHTTCPGNSCPNGSSHTVSLSNVTFAGTHIGGGSQNCGPYSPTADVNCSVGDKLVDAIPCEFQDPSCGFLGTGTVICSVMGQVFGGGINDSPAPGGFQGCFEGPAIFPTTWKSNSNVHVYFDAAVFVGGGCPVPAYCKIFQGIASWDNLTYRGVHYQNMGVVTTSPNCGKMVVKFGQYDAPCNPIYPFMLVSRDKADPLKSYSAGVQNGSHGQASIIGLSDLVTLSDDNHVLTSTGAHEEGHEMGLGDCYGDFNCGLTQSTTIMWWIGTPDSPTAPTPCDIVWANVYERGMR